MQRRDGGVGILASLVLFACSGGEPTAVPVEGEASASKTPAIVASDTAEGSARDAAIEAGPAGTGTATDPGVDGGTNTPTPVSYTHLTLPTICSV